MDNLKVTVIISTYNKTDWLEKVLWGYALQTYKNLEVMIADDGSDDKTLALINEFRKNYPFPLRHIWHEDKGYMRQTILNEAILAAKGDYIIMTDGDCIPKKDFVETHTELAQKGHFLSGGYCKLSLNLSEKLSKEMIENGICFDFKWLRTQEKLGLSNTLKFGSGKKMSKILDKFTPTNPTFNNCNSSGWRSDFIAINGYDERMQYGGPDRDFGERLENAGISGLQIRHRAITLHLDHPRGYKNQASIDKNLAIRAFHKKNKIIETSYGIKQHEGVIRHTER
jgi:glycosyltransferase involved in cell wall biosynthesis